MKSIAINYPGGSLLDIRSQFSDLFYDQTWHKDELFASNKIATGRWEISTEPIKRSFSKTWNEQQELLPSGAEVPPAAVLAYAICKHFKATGERLFENVYVRCSDLDSVGNRVNVGDFDARGLLVSVYWDGLRFSRIGLASARKIETLGELGTSEDLTLEYRVRALEEWRERVQNP